MNVHRGSQLSHDAWSWSLFLRQQKESKEKEKETLKTLRARTTSWLKAIYSRIKEKESSNHTPFLIKNHSQCQKKWKGKKQIEREQEKKEIPLLTENTYFIIHPGRKAKEQSGKGTKLKRSN